MMLPPTEECKARRIQGRCPLIDGEQPNEQVPAECQACEEDYEAERREAQG